MLRCTKQNDKILWRKKKQHKLFSIKWKRTMVVRKARQMNTRNTCLYRFVFSFLVVSLVNFMGAHFFIRLFTLCFFLYFFVFGGPFLSRSQQNFCMSTVFLFAVSVSVQILVGARFFLSHFGWMYEEHECVPRMLFVIYYENH